MGHMTPRNRHSPKKPELLEVFFLLISRLYLHNRREENIKLLNYHTVTHIVIHEKQHALLWGNTQLILFSPLIHKTSLSSSYIM